MKTYMANSQNVDRKWYVIDGQDKVFGRVASQVAHILKGKHKPTYTPHVDCGDHVIVVNADKLIFTGKKLDQKVYYRHSGRPGGLKKTTYRALMAQKPEFALERAVKGMLPKTSLGRQMIKKLRVYAGPEHKHAAQNPTKLDI